MYDELHKNVFFFSFLLVSFSFLRRVLSITPDLNTLKSKVR